MSDDRQKNAAASARSYLQAFSILAALLAAVFMLDRFVESPSVTPAPTPIMDALTAPVPERAAIPDQAIERARNAIIAEPKVLKVAYRPRDVVQWVVGVRSDGSRRNGYASYICLLLREAGADDGSAIVRIVDASKWNQLPDGSREISFGSARCKDGAFLD